MTIPRSLLSLLLNSCRQVAALVDECVLGPTSSSPSPSLITPTHHLLRSTFDSDPYLAYRPSFARSMPIQILLTGVVLTLVAVLFIHLLFTGHYHWSLAPTNYALQMAGVTTLLVSLIWTLHVVLGRASEESAKWYAVRCSIKNTA